MRVAVLLLVLCLGIMTAAQEEGLLILPDGGALIYEGDWVITSEDGLFADDRLTMQSDSRELLVVIYFTPESVLRDHNATDLLSFVEYDYGLYDAAAEQPFDAERVILTEWDGVLVAEYTFQHTDPEFPYDITVLYRLTPDGDGISIEATSYAEIAVGDISSLYDMIFSYLSPAEVSGLEPCQVTLPQGLILRERPSINSGAVRTIGAGGEVVQPTGIEVDGGGSMWYRIEERRATAYARVLVGQQPSEGCDTLPMTR